MHMLIMMFRQSLDEDILRLLAQLKVTGFTLAPKVLGQGETGHAFNSFAWLGCNSMLFLALDNECLEEVCAALREFRDSLANDQHGAKIPLHMFSVACEQML